MQRFIRPTGRSIYGLGMVANNLKLKNEYCSTFRASPRSNQCMMIGNHMNRLTRGFTDGIHDFNGVLEHPDANNNTTVSEMNDESALNHRKIHVNEAFIVPVRSLYCTETMDYLKVANISFGDAPMVKQAGTAIVLLRGDPVSFQRPTPSSAACHRDDAYVILFKFGAIVFFNVPPSDQAKCLDAVRSIHGDNVSKTLHDERFSIVVRPDLPRDQFGVTSSDTVSVYPLRLHTLRVVSLVLAQTVALDFFEERVQGMLEIFRTMNAKMEKHGKLQLSRDELIRNIAVNNSILTNVISNIRVLDRSDTAWTHPHYDAMWENMRYEFDIGDRFKAVDFKLALLKHNSRFYLEILHNQKSSMLEWAIIILLLIEIGLCIFEANERINLRDLKRRLIGSDDDDD